MKQYYNHKWLIYITFSIVILSSFMLIGISINQFGKIDVTPWFYVFLILLTVGSLFTGFYYYKIYLLLLDKNITIDELVTKLNFRLKEKEKQKKEVINLEQRVNIDSIVSKLLPDANQNFEKFSEQLLRNFANQIEGVQGLMYLKNKKSSTFETVSRYAYYTNQMPPGFRTGETIPGQVAKDKKYLKISKIPDGYINVSSGLGKALPKFIVYIPFIDNNETFAIMEMATFKDIDQYGEQIIEKLIEEIPPLIKKIKTSE